MKETNLTEEEAERFLELYEKVSEDMNTAMSDSMDSDADEKSVFVERYDGGAASLYTDCVRNKYRRFVKNIYISEE
jgi:hypothetical protein